MIAPLLAALLLPLAPLSAQECEVSPHEPVVLRDQRIPFYEVVETFLLHAAIAYDTQGADGYRAFLLEYGLDPQMQSLQDLPWAFDDLQRSVDLKHDEVEHETARRLGEILAKVSADLAENHPRGVDAVRDLRLRLGTQLRPVMSLTFIDGNPNFSKLDGAEEAFYDALEAAGKGTVEALMDAGGPLDMAHGGSHEGAPEATSPSFTRVKLSFLKRQDGATLSLKELRPADLVELEWRSYARTDGRTRVIALVLSGEEQLGLVDISLKPGHQVRDELEPEGPGGLLRYVEYVSMAENQAEKSHTTLGCIAASAAAALACVACASPPDPVTCGACVAALASAAAACNQPHCNQIQCNANCVGACHQYGWCSSTSGSSSPLDCQCFGIRFDTPGCEPHGPGCSIVVTEVSVLPLDGGDPLRLSTGSVTLSRLEESAVMHHGEEVRYLMDEWAVLAREMPTAANGSASSLRTLRSSSPAFGASQAEQLRSAFAAASGGNGDRVAIAVAIPPHDANSREIPMPALKIASADLPPGVARGKVAIRADFSEAGELQDFRVLHDTLGGISPQLAAQIEQALSLEHVSEERHRVVAFAILSVGESLSIDSREMLLPKCCCGDHFCV